MVDRDITYNWRESRLITISLMSKEKKAAKNAGHIHLSRYLGDRSLKEAD